MEFSRLKIVEKLSSLARVSISGFRNRSECQQADIGNSWFYEFGRGWRPCAARNLPDIHRSALTRLNNSIGENTLSKLGGAAAPASVEPFPVDQYRERAFRQLYSSRMLLIRKFQFPGVILSV